jgi:chitinase
MDGGVGFREATSPETLNRFARSIAEFINQYGYDGVDIDWEKDIDVNQFEKLIRELRNIMPRKVITLAGGNWGDMPSVASVSQTDLDQINVMCYDMDVGHGCSGLDCTWYNSSVFQGGEADKHACEWRVRAFLLAGVAASKIGIGIPLYGRRHVGATEPGVKGKFPRYTVYYRDLAVDQERWQQAYQRYDAVHKANYLSIEPLNEFVSYTGTQFIADTVAWMRSAGFGGIMEFVTEYEYLSGQIGDARYPLSTTVRNEVLRRGGKK